MTGDEPSPTPPPAGHRILLSADELEAVRRAAGHGVADGAAPVLPPGFAADVAAGVGRDARRQALAAAQERLVGRGLLRRGADGRPDQPGDPALVAALRALAAPPVAVLVHGRAGGRELQAVLAVAGATLAGLVRWDDTAVELFWAAAPALASELSRLVARLEPSLSGGPDERLADRAAGARAAPAGARGSLVVTTVAACVGPVGSVVWLAAAAGWVGLRSAPSVGDGERAVTLVPCGPPVIGHWVAPFVATAVLAATSPVTSA